MKLPASRCLRRFDSREDDAQQDGYGRPSRHTNGHTHMNGNGATSQKVGCHGNRSAIRPQKLRSLLRTCSSRRAPASCGLEAGSWGRTCSHPRACLLQARPATGCAL